MLRSVLFLIVFSFSFISYGQLDEDSYVNPARLADKRLPLAYLGPVTGLYNYSGLLGLTVEAPITPKISGFVAGGLGGWGYKAGFGVQFYLNKAQFGSALGVGYSNAFGLTDFQTELELADGTTQAIVMDLHNAGTLNFTYQYNFHLGKRSKLVLGTGYALAVSEKPYRVTNPNNAQLSQTSAQVMQILQPGGLILSLGFLFAVD